MTSVYKGLLWIDGKEFINSRRVLNATGHAGILTDDIISSCANCRGLQFFDNYVWTNQDVFFTQSCSGCENEPSLHAEAPWFDPKKPAFLDALGLYGLELYGFDNYVLDVNIAESIYDGGFLIKSRATTRELELEFYIVACNSAGSSLLFKYMHDVLSCIDHSTVSFLRSHPENNSDIEYVYFRDVILTTPPTVESTGLGKGDSYNKSETVYKINIGLRALDPHVYTRSIDIPVQCETVKEEFQFIFCNEDTPLSLLSPCFQLNQLYHCEKTFSIQQNSQPCSIDIGCKTMQLIEGFFSVDQPVQQLFVTFSAGGKLLKSELFRDVLEHELLYIHVGDIRDSLESLQVDAYSDSNCIFSGNVLVQYGEL